MPLVPPHRTAGWSLSRRTLLRTAGAASMAGLLGSSVTGCGGAEEPQSGADTLGLTFPENFTWGAATSAYQIEGAATEDGRGPSIWDTFSHTPGRVRGGDTGDVAADHYHRWESDLDLMAELELASYRFSISWPRVLPEGRGQINQAGLDFYQRLVDGLLERGITPVVTLFHWDLPQALEDLGGWLSRDTAGYFADYATVLVEALGDRVSTWLTLNEPKTVVIVGYQAGIHAPGRRDRAESYIAMHHLMLAHGLGVQALRAGSSQSRIGPALNLTVVYPADDSPEAEAQAERVDGFENRLYLDPVLRGAYPEDTLDEITQISPMVDQIHDGDLEVISTPIDVLAVQYYNPTYVDANGERVTRHPTSEASWQQIHPDGLYDVLTRVTRDYGDIPLLITENGVPTPDAVTADGTVDDPDRITFLRSHLAAAHRAIADGVPLEGYHVWSLLDNFEWAEGYSQRWGIVYVDFDDQRRIPKASAEWYRDVIRRNGI